MRVIAGEFRSRRLAAPSGQATRPTSDRLRETLFNVLGPRLQGTRFADLYAGSGAVGIEALSRGAAFCFFAERSPAATKAIRANLAALGLPSRASLDERGVTPLLHRLVRDRTPALDIIFLDPPYTAEDEYLDTLQYLAEHGAELLASHALVIAEHARRDPLPASFGALQRTRLLEQGDAALSFYAIENTTVDATEEP